MTVFGSPKLFLIIIRLPSAFFGKVSEGDDSQRYRDEEHEILCTTEGILSQSVDPGFLVPR